MKQKSLKTKKKPTKKEPTAFFRNLHTYLDTLYTIADHLELCTFECYKEIDKPMMKHKCSMSIVHMYTK